MKNFRLIVRKLFLLAIVLSTQGVFAKDEVIEKLEFRQSRLNEVVRFLSDYTGMNIVTTPDASATPIDVYLQNVTVRQAIEMIAKSNGLWYREEPDNNAFRLMTTEEYQDDLVVYRDDVTKIFDLLNANVIDMAQMIKSVYGARVRVALGRQPGDVFQANSGGQGGQGGQNGQNGQGGSGNNSNSSANGGSQGGLQSGNQSLFNAQPSERLNKVNGELSGVFLEQIDRQRMSQESNQVSVSALNSIGAQEAPISVSVNNEHNLLVVRTTDRQTLAEIEALVDSMNKPVPQVLLEMKIIDVSIGDDFRSIFDLQADVGTSDVLDTSNTFRPSNQIGLGNFAPQGGSFIYRFLDDSLSVTLEILRQQNRVNVLATPVLLAANHRQAELFIGTETVITTGFNTSTSDIEGVSRTFITTQTDVREIGNRIALTPRINSNQTVTLQLEQETSSVNVGGGQLFVATDNQVVPLRIDTINKAEIEGTFMVENGKTVAVGGLIRETKSKATSKVPVLGDIPGLKWLFRKETQSEERSEFVLLITPHIIYHSSEAEKITREKIIDKSQYSHWPTEQVMRIAIKPTQEPPRSLVETLGLNQGSTTSVLSDKVKIDTDQITNEQQNIIDLLKFANAQNNGQKVSLPGVEASGLNNKKRVKIFSNRKLKVTPLSSFFYQGLYVTSLSVKTSSKKLIEITAEQVKGNWLSMSMTNSVVVVNQPVNLFLVSDRPFEKAFKNTQ